MQEPIRKAIFGNVGTIISFKVGADDAEHLARHFHPVFSEEDLVNPPRYSMYQKLMTTERLLDHLVPHLYLKINAY